MLTIKDATVQAEVDSVEVLGEPLHVCQVYTTTYLKVVNTVRPSVDRGQQMDTYKVTRTTQG